MPVKSWFVPDAAAKMRQDALTIASADGKTETKFTIEVATTDQEKALGLMFRTKLGDREGMLFPYDRAQIISMWMKNTYIALDMVFIRPDGTISEIAARAEPLSERIISSKEKVSAVLEIPGGAAERLAIRPADRVRYRLFAATP